MRKLCRRYIAQTVCFVALLAVATELVAVSAGIDGLASPLVVSVIFALVVDVADIFVWRKIASKSDDALSAFFSAVSGFRMLLALATLLGCYIAVGRGAMLEYCVVFFVFYLALMLHHSIFFTHLSNSRVVRDTDNENK